MQVYFRSSEDTEYEFQICSSIIPTVRHRTELSKSDTTPVVCRYSALPYYEELEEDLKNMGLFPINSYSEHCYIASMDYIHDVRHLTFPTWYQLSDVPETAYPIVIKGRTNSRKFEWNTKMFAKDRETAINIMHELWHDPMIGPQGLVFRQYVPLETYEVGINGMPMTNEWRCFFYGDALVDYGYYWSSLDDLSKVDRGSFESDGLPFAQECANIISDWVGFFAVDVARDVNGRWWLVEVNDAQMSGLSTIDPVSFYRKLKEVVE